MHNEKPQDATWYTLLLQSSELYQPYKKTRYGIRQLYLHVHYDFFQHDILKQ